MQQKGEKMTEYAAMKEFKLKDYKLSEVKRICKDGPCDERCPFHVMNGQYCICFFGERVDPENWPIEEPESCPFEEPQDGPDQTIKADAGKLPLTAVPRAIIRAIGEVRYYGMSKYPNGGIDNWKKVDPQRYRDAAFRHFLAYLDNPEGYDEESGLPHLWHLACNIAFLIELDKEGKR